MKTRLIPNHTTIAAALCGLFIFSFAACKGKSKQGEANAEGVSTKPTVELDPSSFDSQRTQAFGFLSRLPASTEGALGIRNLSDLVSAILESTTYKRAAKLARDSGQDFDQQVAGGREILNQYVGKELFLVFSGGCGKQFERLQYISGLISEMNMRSAGATIAGDGDGASDMVTAMLTAVRKGLKDPDSELSKSIEKFQMPPIILGSKISDGADELVAGINAFEANLPPHITVGKVEVGGSEFTTWKIHLQDVLTDATEAELNELLGDPAASKRVVDMLRKKKVEVAIGVIDNYFIVSLGAGHSHLQFVDEPDESILAAQSFGFADQFLSKKLLGYSFMSKTLLESGAKGGQLTKMAKALGEGMGGGNASMKELSSALLKLGTQADKMAKRECETQVGVALLDNGIRGESIGGYSSDVVDSRAKTQFANSAPSDAAMVISSVANPDYRGDSIAMIETIFELVDAGSNVYAENTGNDQIPQMKQMFSPDMTKIWGILKGKFIDGLGSQSGIIVDLKGGMPKIPGAPNVLVNQGKVPRVALAVDVKDRAKLAAAWNELVPTINDALLKVPGQEPGAELQLPDVMTDEGGGLETHFIPLPFLANDFVPSLSLNDKLFFLSTSKTFVQGLAGNAGTAGDIRGTYVMMNFSEFQKFADGWIKLLLQNADTVFGENGAEDFMQQAGQMQMALEFTKGIRKFEFNRYENDGGDMRSSWHLNIEDIGPEVD